MRSAAAVRIPGTYSNLEMNEDGGDLLGMEIKIVPIGVRYQGVADTGLGPAGRFMTLPDSKPEPGGPIALIEPHDSRVGAVVIPATGPSRIEFAHLAVYHTRDIERYEIWSYQAVLEISGVDRMLVEGGSEVRDHVDDGMVLLDGEELVDWKALLDPRPVTRIKLTFGSGRIIDIRCREAQLRLQHAIKHMEDWVGPLDPSPSAQ